MIDPPIRADVPITFAIPCFAGREYLRAAIESVLSQTISSWELLVVVDDQGGDAGVRAIVAECRESLDEPRRSSVRYFENDQNLGMVANWNRCLDLAQAPLVTLLHQDDRLEPGYGASMLQLASDHPEATAYFCDARIIDAGGQPSWSVADTVKAAFVPRGGSDIVVRGEAGASRLMRGNFLFCPSLCLKRDELRGRRFSEEWKQVQDLEFTTRLLMEGAVLVGSRGHHYAYRRHSGNATTRQSESLLRFHEELELFDRVADSAEILGWSRLVRVCRRKGIVRLHLLFRALLDLAGLRLGRAVEKISLMVRGR